MNIKLTEFNGLYTNHDENDLRLELFRQSVNFRHEKGFAAFEGNTFAEFNRCFTLPEGYTWEKGCIATITSDPLSDNLDLKSYEVFVIVAKRRDMVNGDMLTSRKIYMSEYGSDVSYGLFQEDVNPMPNCNIHESEFGSWVTQQEVHFLNINGILKIYLPNMSFWLGRLERVLYRAGLQHPNPINGFYFDRLIEPYDPDNLGTDIRNGLDDIHCRGGRRLGFYSEISVVSSSGTVTEAQIIDSTYQGLKNIGTTGFSRFDAYGFYFTDHDSGDIVYPLTQMNPSDEKMHMFYRDMDTQSNFMLIPVSFNSTLKFADNSTLEAHYGHLVIFEPHIAPSGWYQNGVSYYRVTVEVFNSDTSALGLKWMGETVSSTGFSNIIKKLDVVVTATLDRNSEVIIYKQSVNTITADEYFALKFSNTSIPKDSNARITGLNIYVKAVSYIDYKLAKSIDFLNPKEKDITQFFVTEEGLSDVLLTQNIGFAYDSQSEKYYRLLTGLRDVTYERGYSLALSTYNTTSVYYSAIGSGRIMSDIFYPSSQVEHLGLNKVNAVTSTNGRFIALDSFKSSVITVSGEGVHPVIDIVDDLEYGVKSKRDIEKTQTGLIINSAKGIFVTNGFEKQKISEPVNDIVEINYSTSFIHYNPVKGELLYFPNETDKPLRYRFDREKWEQLHYQDTEAVSIHAKSYLSDSMGQEIIISESVFRRSGFNAYPSGSLVTNFSDLGEATIDKLLNKISFDMKGIADITLVMDEISVSYTFQTLERKTVELNLPAKDRSPFSKFKLICSVNSGDFTLYKAELDITPLRRRINGTKEIRQYSPKKTA